MTLTRFDTPALLEVIWEALEGYRENCISEGEPSNDKQWDDICTAMSWLTEDLEGL
jgi:hypothetical protein